MKFTLKSLAPFLLLTLLTYTGCAKQQVIRKDEVPAPAVATQPAAPAAQPAAAQPADIAAPSAGAPVAATPVAEANLVAEKPAVVDNSAELQRQLAAIYFDFDSQVLSDASRQTLSNNAALLTKNPQLKVRVEGNCDERGSDEYNLALGQQRAESAVKYLRSLGVPAERLSAVSYGKEKPAVAGHDEAAWSKNRRDDFVIVR